MKEIWGDIPGYEGYYQVSTTGKVRSLDRDHVVNTRYGGTTIRRDKGRIITGTSNGNGYLAVYLQRDGKRTRRYIHRLVAEAFLLRLAGEDTVNHKDHDRQNNSAENLEWCTQADNVRYSADLMRKQKNTHRLSNSGEKYIYRRCRNGKEKFRVHIQKLGICREFASFEDALRFRNEVMLDA